MKDKPLFTAKPYFKLFRRSQPGYPCWNALFGFRLNSCRAFDLEGHNRERIILRELQSQIDLVNALYSTDPLRTLELRYVARSCEDTMGLGEVEIYLLCKLAAGTRKAARAAAGGFFDELSAVLYGGFPNYEFEMLADANSLESALAPFPIEHVVDIRRREDRVNLRTLRNRASLTRPRRQAASDSSDHLVYLVHPFFPTDNTVSRLISILMLHSSPMLYSVALQPVSLTKEEHKALEEELGKTERTFLVGEGGERLESVFERRAAELCDTLLELALRLEDAPYMIRISLASPDPIPKSLAEATGVEITEPAGNPALDSYYWRSKLERGGYDTLFPRGKEERRRAAENVLYLEVEPWGKSMAPKPLERLRYLVDAAEANAAFRLPIPASDGVPGLTVNLSRAVPIPDDFLRKMVARRKKGAERARAGGDLLLGVSRRLGVPWEVLISPADRLRHVYVVGQTGTGKSTLLRSMLLRDLEQGAGFCLLDPHGDLFKEVLSRIPEEREQDVVIIDPSDKGMPVGINLLEWKTKDERHAIALEVAEIVRRLTVDVYRRHDYIGPAFLEHVQMNLLLVMSNPDDPGTLLEFYTIFTKPDYWRRWLPLRTYDENLQHWVTHTLPRANYQRLGDDAIGWGPYLRTKFQDFVFDPVLRNIFGQKRSTIDIEKIMDEGKVLLVDLSQGALSARSAAFLGMIILSLIRIAVKRRSKQERSNRRPFYLYVDEFQNVATGTFVELLSEARKFGIGLVLANQFVSQIDNEQIQKAIFGNVGTVACFRVGQQDARLIAPQVLPTFTETDLMALPNYVAAVRTFIEGEPVRPFTVQTIPPEPRGTDEAKRARRVMDLSRGTYGRKRQEVEKEMRESLKFEIPGKVT